MGTHEAVVYRFASRRSVVPPTTHTLCRRCRGGTSSRLVWLVPTSIGLKMVPSSSPPAPPTPPPPTPPPSPPPTAPPPPLLLEGLRYLCRLLPEPFCIHSSNDRTETAWCALATAWPACCCAAPVNDAISTVSRIHPHARGQKLLREPFHTRLIFVI